MNRQQRRKIERQNRKITRPAYKGMTKEQRMDALVKNGITAEDLKQEWHDGFEAGFREACPATVRTLYAAVLLAAHDVVPVRPATRCAAPECRGQAHGEYPVQPGRH